MTDDDDLPEFQGVLQPNSESVDYDLELEPDDGEVGDDGLTEKQSATLAARYRETIGNPRLSEAEMEAYKVWKAGRHELPE